ncbi:M56 family metallopeptidase [Paenibacillus sp. NPDC058071]|uniref:M56 family metallopeptidase n=1 Tax=Paenibacillus sp. NPDC058071 TaxID=3346326 RepID=UPI0036DEA674
MRPYLELLITLTVAGSTVVICILLLRLLSPHIFSARWHFIMSKLALCSYLLPVSFLINMHMGHFTSKPRLNASLPEIASAFTQEESVQGLASLFSGLSISAEMTLVILCVWGIGVLSLGGWHIFCYRRFIKRIQSTNVPAPEDSTAVKQLALQKRELGIRENVQLAFNSIVRSPVLVGLLKPTILLPLGSRVDEGLSMIIQHELVHLKRKDLWVKMLVLLASALHWFNPFVHLLRRDIHMWSEFSCDEEVVKEMSYAERKRYGETILNVMIGSKELPVNFCASLSADGKQLKRRLSMMLNVRKLKKRSVMMSAAILIVIGAVGCSIAVWAAKNTPDIKGTVLNNIPAPDYPDYNENSFADLNEHDYTFGALTPEQQKLVTKEMAYYYLNVEGDVVFVNPETEKVPFRLLTKEQQKQASKKLGHFSLREVRSLSQ